MLPSPACIVVRPVVAFLSAVLLLGFSSAASAQTYHFATLAGLPQTGSADGPVAGARVSEPVGVAVDGTTTYITDRSNHTIRKIDAGATVSTLAGLAGVSGFVNASGSAARFNRPGGIALGADGILYVADTSAHAIRKVTSTGVVTTLAGSGVAGGADGTGAAAQFSNPNGIAVDSDLNVYVADTVNNAIRRITPAGVVTTLAGALGVGGVADGVGGAARFAGPFGLVLSADESLLFVADSAVHTIRQVVVATGAVTTVAGSPTLAGTTNGTGTAARFNGVRGMARDAADNLYVVEVGSHLVRKIAPGFVVTTLSGIGSGFANGAANATRFNQPLGVAVNAAGTTVYVADSLNALVRSVSAATGASSTFAGTYTGGLWDATGSAARFTYPAGIAVNPVNGLIYTGSQISHTIRQITSRGVTTSIAGQVNTTGTTDGQGTGALFNAPNFMAVDPTTGNVFVADRANHAIRRVTPAGVVTTIAGLAGTAGAADGTGTSARFNNPAYIEIAPDGVLYVADNQAIRQVTQAGVVTTISGLLGTSGSADGTGGVGGTARFNGPAGMAVDATYIYVVDFFSHTLRRVTRANGTVTTLAGTSGTSGSVDATGSAARFFNPSDVALDSAGDLYVADYNNHTIRRVTPAGVVTTIAGLAGNRGSADGSGTTARFFQPAAIAFGKHDTMFVADRSNHTIRMGVKATTNVVTNGSFASGTDGWLQFGLPTQDHMVSNVTGGVFQFQRGFVSGSNATQAVVFQETGLPLGANAPVQAQFQIGNSDAVRKRISVLFHDSDFADLSVCTFFLPPNAPLQTYTMRSHTTKQWGSATVSFYAATNGTGGFYRLDNVTVQYTPANSASETMCVDATTPSAPGGAASVNLIANGDFGAGLAPWAPFGQIDSNVTGGVFQFRKLAGTPAGVVLQATGQNMTANQILTATFQLGNSSGQRQRTTVILHDNNFSDLSACTFWIEPNTPLQTYAYRTFATQAWANATFSVYPATVNGAQWLRLDNVTLQRTSATTIVGTECIEPSVVADVMGDLARSAPTVPVTVTVPPGALAGDGTDAAEATSDAGVEADGFDGSAADGWQAEATTSGRRVLTLDEPVDLTGATTATLRLDSWLTGVLSRAVIEVSLDDDLWAPVHVVAPSDTWMPIEIDLRAFTGHRLHVRFVFDAVAPSPGTPADTWRIEAVVVESD